MSDYFHKLANISTNYSGSCEHSSFSIYFQGPLAIPWQLAAPALLGPSTCLFSTPWKTFPHIPFPRAPLLTLTHNVSCKIQLLWPAICIVFSHFCQVLHFIPQVNSSLIPSIPCRQSRYVIRGKLEQGI